MRLLLFAFLFLANSTAQAEIGVMRFKLMQDCQESRCQHVALGVGEITDETPKDLQAFINAHPQVRNVFLHSPGGALGAGIDMGGYLRKRGLDTTLTSKMRCFSACAYAFLGGNRREVREGGIIGVHRFYSEKGRSDEQTGQVVQAVLTRYVESMGVSTQLLALASRAGADDMVGIDRDDAQKLRVDNTRIGIESWTLSPFEGELVATSEGMDQGSDRTMIMMVSNKPTHILVAGVVSEPRLHPQIVSGSGFSLSLCIAGSCIESADQEELRPYKGDEETRMAVFLFDKTEFLDFVEQGVAEGKANMVFVLRKGQWKTHLAGKVRDFHTVINRAESPAARPTHTEPPTVELRRDTHGIYDF